MRPTAVQRTIPHEHAIDGIPFPSIRDRMILLRGRYDLVEAYQGMLLEVSRLLYGEPCSIDTDMTDDIASRGSYGS